MSSSEERSGLKHGCLIASILPLVHALLFVLAGAGLSATSNLAQGAGWLTLIGGSFFLLVAYFLTLLMMVPIILLLSFTDRNATGFIANNWPILLAVSYPIWGGWIVPGPFDEAVVGGIGLSLQVWFTAQRFRLARRLGQEEEQRRELGELAVRELPAPTTRLGSKELTADVEVQDDTVPSNRLGR